MTRGPDSYKRLDLLMFKDHHGGIPEYRFQIEERDKPKWKQGPNCPQYTGTFTFFRADSEDETEVAGLQLAITNFN
jgi:hypothetical protein